MTESAHRKKTILLFVAISAFGFFVSKKVDNTNTPSNLQKSEYVVTTQVKNESESTVTPETLFFEVDDELKPLERVYPEMVLNESEVLGSTSCPSGDNIYSTEKICSREVGEFDKNMRGGEEKNVGERISRNAKISLLEVEVPPLLSGSPVMDSSVRQIYIDEEANKDYWTLRPSGEMINREILEGNTYPGDKKTKNLLDFGESTRNVKYGLKYELGVSGEAVVEGDSESSFTVHEYHENDCGDKCRNNPNAAPGNYLTNSGIMTHSMNYPAYYSNLEEAGHTEVIEDCDVNSQFLDMEIEGNTAIGCTPTIFEVVVNFFKRILSPKDVVDCSPLPPDAEEDYRDECVSLASIVIIMESPWGTKQDCDNYIDGKCVNEFSNLRGGNFNPPDSGQNEHIYVLTDCSINVNYEAKKVKCAWDVDYIAEELDFQAYDNVPTEKYPDRMDYLDFHVRESENREDPVFEMN